jgi:hypothetical protein
MAPSQRQCPRRIVTLRVGNSDLVRQILSQFKLRSPEQPHINSGLSSTGGSLSRPSDHQPVVMLREQSDTEVPVTFPQSPYSPIMILAEVPTPLRKGLRARGLLKLTGRAGPDTEDKSPTNQSTTAQSFVLVTSGTTPFAQRQPRARALSEVSRQVRDMTKDANQEARNRDGIIDEVRRIEVILSRGLFRKTSWKQLENGTAFIEKMATEMIDVEKIKRDAKERERERHIKVARREVRQVNLISLKRKYSEVVEEEKGHDGNEDRRSHGRSDDEAG